MERRFSAPNKPMVFQSYALYPHMSVAENIATPLNMAELSSLERAPLIGRLFGASKINGFENGFTADNFFESFDGDCTGHA